MKPHAWFFALALAATPLCAWAAPEYDIQIPSGGISVDHTNVFVGQTAKIYVNIDNIGEKDVEGMAVFKEDGVVIGQKAISAKATGRVEEIWQTWKPTTVGNHTVEVSLNPETPDATPENNSGQITVFVDKDTDGDGTGDSIDTDDDNDGVPDTTDQFPLDPNRSKDTDGDGIDDSVDSDDDNDGLYDWDEKTIGTDPLKRDTDGDHVGDKEDAFPLDPKRWDPEPAPTTSGGGGSSGGSGGGSNATINDQGSQGSSGASDSGSSESGSSSSDQVSENTGSGSSGAGSTTSTLLTADGRVASAEDASNSSSSTMDLLTTTTTAQTLTTSSSVETTDADARVAAAEDPQTQTQEESKSWGLSMALWGLALFFGLLAGLFIWLAKRRKDEEEPYQKPHLKK